jgi:hypothetical protein
MNLFGSIAYINIDGNKYGLIIADDYSRFTCVDVVSSDILSRNEKNATMQDQSQGRTRRVFRLVQALRRVKTLRPVLLYYEM